MTDLNPNDRVTAYGRNGTIIRLTRKHGQYGADVWFDRARFTEFYPLDALTVILKSQVKP
jgi:hypothetical protein